MFFAELSHDDDSWLPVVDQHVRRAVGSLSDNGSAGLYAGPASVLAAVLNVRTQYIRLRTRLSSWVARDQLDRLHVAVNRELPGVSWSDYDAVNGLAGTGRLLLSCLHEDAVEPVVSEAFNKTVDHLCRLSESILVDGHEVPGWWVPQELEPVEQDRREYPRGDFNLGLAHGVAGPLAFLSQAVLQAEHLIDRTRVSEATARIAAWLAGWTQHDRHGIYWPCRVSWDDEVAHAPGGQDPTSFTRTAWCYGAPGVTAALHQAALALHDDDLTDLATEAARSTARRPVGEWRIAGPTMCHGSAGVLAATTATATALQITDLDVFQLRLMTSIAESADPDCAFGYIHAAPTSPGGWQHSDEVTRLDGAGLLEGAAGVGCALISAWRSLTGVREEGTFGWLSSFLMR